MKTLFALLGLFMFASISTTEVVANNNNSDEPVLTCETSGEPANGGKKQLVILQ